jgi:hypothetical protein
MQALVEDVSLFKRDLTSLWDSAPAPRQPLFAWLDVDTPECSKCSSHTEWADVCCIPPDKEDAELNPYWLKRAESHGSRLRTEETPHEIT